MLLSFHFITRPGLQRMETKTAELSSMSHVHGSVHCSVHTRSACQGLLSDESYASALVHAWRTGVHKLGTYCKVPTGAAVPSTRNLQTGLSAAGKQAGARWEVGYYHSVHTSVSAKPECAASAPQKRSQL